MKKTFEIPYNFNKNFLLYTINDIENYYDKIHSVYLPCFTQHGECTRTYLSYYYPKDLKEYIEHITYIKSFGLKPNILFQDFNKNSLENEIIDFYKELGIKIFTVYNDSIAFQIKHAIPDSVIIASITKQLDINNLKKNDLYDYYVIDFRYNLQHEIVFKNKNNIIIMPNTNCRIETKMESCMKHWQNKEDYNCCYGGTSCFINPKELHKFDKYVSFYKLQGREILNESHYYTQIINYMNEYFCNEHGTQL